MTKLPKVSILVPVYNRAHCIEQTLESALAQTFTDFEVVVVDNCSNDGSWELINNVAARDCRVRAFRNNDNIGPVRNWLRCVHEARGALGKILWSDDLLHSDYLNQTVPALADHEVGFVYTPALIFSGSDPLAGLPYFDMAASGKRPSSEFIEGILLNKDYPVSPGCALFRMSDVRDCLLEHVPNQISSDFSMHAIGNDLLLFLLVAARYRFFVRLKAPLSYFRAHAGSITVSASRGKIPLHYNIAKAWFVSQSPQPEQLTKRFNAMLLSDLLVYRSNDFGLCRIEDFYPDRKPRPVAWLWLARRLVQRFLEKAWYSLCNVVNGRPKPKAA